MNKNLSSLFAVIVAATAPTLAVAQPSAPASQITQRDRDAGLYSTRCIAKIYIAAASTGTNEELRSALQFYKADAKNLLKDEAIPTFERVLPEEISSFKKTTPEDFSVSVRGCVNFSQLVR